MMLLPYPKFIVCCSSVLQLVWNEVTCATQFSLVGSYPTSYNSCTGRMCVLKMNLCSFLVVSGLILQLEAARSNPSSLSTSHTSTCIYWIKHFWGLTLKNSFSDKLWCGIWNINLIVFSKETSESRILEMARPEILLEWPACKYLTCSEKRLEYGAILNLNIN